MAKSPIQTTIVIAGKLASSFQKAFKDAKNHSETLDKAFEVTKKIGVASFKAIGAAAGSIGAAVIASAEATRDYRKDLAKLYSNAELAGASQKEAWGGLEGLYAVSGDLDSANEAMANLFATGYKGKDLTKIIEAVNGASIKWSQTITQSSLAEAINETVMSGKSVGQFDEILARSGVNLDTFNDGLLTCSGLAERQQYVLNWLAKSGLTEVNAAYQEQNKSLITAQKAELKYQDSMAKLGEVADTIMPSVKGLAADGIAYFAQKLKGVDLASVSNALEKAGELGKKAFDTIWNALSKIDWDSLINNATTVLTIFTNIFNFVVNNWGTISPIIYTIVGALTAYKVVTTTINTITAISNSLKSIMAARSALVAGKTLAEASAAGAAAVAQGGLNLAFLACPITWIVVGIAAIVAAFVLLWNKCEGFRNFWKGAWEMIKIAFAVAQKMLTAGFDSIKQKIQPIVDLVQSLIGKFKEAGEALKNSKIGKAVNGAVSWVGDKLGIGKNALGGTYSSPLVTWVAEGGDTETIVPHNNKPRSKALALEAVRGTGLNIGGGTYVFSPTIYASGGNTSELNSILDDAMIRFKAMLEEYEQQKARVSY